MAEEEKGNRPPCAACKHQRKKCILGKCILHEVFPASEHKEFEAVHKLFGISNITKKMGELTSSEDRIEAAKALKYEAMLWEKDPVCGASGEISRLTRKLEKSREMNRNLLGYTQQLQWRPVPEHHDHMMYSSSNSVLVNNEHMRLEHGVPHSQAAMRNQETGAPHVLQRQHPSFQNQEVRPLHRLSRQHPYLQNQEIRPPHVLQWQHPSFQNQEVRPPHVQQRQHPYLQNQAHQVRPP